MIIFHPDELLKKVAPERLVKNLVTKKLSLNRAALSMVAESGIVSKSKLTDIALKVIKTYREKFKDERAAGATKAEATAEALNDKKLMVQQVSNTVVHEVAKDIKSEYVGEKYTWLPSSAEVPDPLHQLNYGKVFRIGLGEMPGDRWGCQCGMKIHVKETELDI